MEEEQYLKDRVDGQIKWYGNRSGLYKKMFMSIRSVEIVLASSIPFMVGFVSDFLIMKYIVGIIGVLIAIFAGVLSLFKFQENWITYRTTTESLKHEKYLYLTKCKPYDVENPFCLLVENIESLISKENTKWMTYIKKPKEDKDG